MSQPTLQPTPRLDSLLDRLGRLLTGKVLLHGMGTVLLAAAAWLLFAFVVDVLLHVPRGVRLFHLLVALALPGFFLVRELVRPLGRRPDREGLAVLMDRAVEPNEDTLVSAVQLRGTDPADEGAPLVRRLLERADELAAGLEPRRAVDASGPHKRFAVGLGSSLALGAMFLAMPTYGGIFLQRMLGRDVPWPQMTRLVIEVPETDVVRVARGSDVPVVVRAEGSVPDQVRLVFGSGHEATLSGAGGGTFRTLLRSVQEDIEFTAVGGDDRSGNARVRLIVLQPPDVAGLAIEIEPPAYADLPPRVEFDRDVEVLAGSRLRVTVQPTPANATGAARVLPADSEIPLEPTPFPARPDDPEDAEPRPGLAFEIVAKETLRYMFALQDETGLPNPDPGLFAVHVVQDRAPELDLLAPGRGNVDTIIGGALPLHVLVRDDFGLSGASYVVELEGAESELEARELTLRPLDDEGGATDAGAGPGAPRRALASARIETQEFASVEGVELVLTVSAEDNRAPEPLASRPTAVRVRIVSRDEFERRLQDRLARVRVQATTLGELQREKLGRVQDLIALSSSDGLSEEDSAGLTAALSGQRRVQGDATSLSRELSGVVGAVVYARLDERAEGLLEFLDEKGREATERGFRPQLWRDLVDAQAAGQFGNVGLAGKLVDILARSLDVSHVHAAAATEALDDAQDAEGLSARLDALQLAANSQHETLRGIESLLELLSKWDNFQSILTLTRDILKRQENLEERTKEFAKDN